MKMNKGGDEQSSLSEINIIPLVDIMLVLLIIFMVTAPMMQEGIDINLPEVSAEAVDVAEEDFILSVARDGEIYLNEDKDQKFAVNSIEPRLMEAFKDKPKKILYLKADNTIRYGYIMEVMAACRRAGVEQIGMITQTPEEKEISQNRRVRR
ncbi:MAG: protein TolR [Deltaproteobacteria bacterium]|nr:protein TolR [Deltaproteobacteria bacterium]